MARNSGVEPNSEEAVDDELETLEEYLERLVLWQTFAEFNVPLSKVLSNLYFKNGKIEVILTSSWKGVTLLKQLL